MLFSNIVTAPTLVVHYGGGACSGVETPKQAASYVVYVGVQLDLGFSVLQLRERCNSSLSIEHFFK
ncbi:MAG: hypothetical protein P8Q95_06005, partial [Candidatus Poseidoniaceae archaeon]|nr:hypothetical protein [Candidatus Poseidoniaceae archaeon]